MDVTAASPATESQPVTPATQPEVKPVEAAPQAAPEAPEVKQDEKAEEKPEEKKDDKFATKFAALARREKQIQAREAKAKELEAKFASFDKLESEIRSNPIKFLESRGITYSDLTAMMLNEGKLTPDQKLRQVEEKLSEFERQRQEEAERKQKEAEEAKKLEQQQKYKQVLDGFVKQIGDYVETNAATLELTKAHPEGASLIYNVIDAHHEKTGRLMKIEEAAKHVESYLEEEAQKLLSVGKLKAKLAPAQAPVKEAAPKSHAAVTTLTNSAQTDVPAPQERPLTVEESLERAAKLLKWTS